MKDEKKAPKLRFKGFTDDWEQCKLKNKAEIVRGASPRPISNPKWFDDNSNVGWLRISDVTEQKGRIHHLSQHISKAGQSKTRVITEPHLLLSIAATVGSPVINYVNTGVHDGFLIFLNPTFNKEFMFQWLLMFKPYWNKYGQPGSQVNLNSDIVGNQSVAFPTTSEQERIANFFSELDTAITLHEEKKQQLKCLKSALLQKMFAYKNKSGDPDVRFKGFDERWERHMLNDLAIFNPKGTLPTSFEYVDLGSVIGVEMISHKTISKFDAPSRAQRLAQVGDLFYQTVRPYQQNNYLFDNKDNAYVFSTGYAQLRPLIDGYFLLCLVQTKSFVRKVMNACTGTSYPAINSQDLAQIGVNIPINSKEQRLIGNLYKVIDNLIMLYQQKLDDLNTIKQSLLQKMFI
ncbi:restriction endonuclease subunit S [Lactobacillus delbrueckii]|uniref:restriction endonuclease subunit S n=1 Tax=Lactobacillus delbrueckii TaxID=1584 RepID=UPI0021825A9C|nr:restriction endonuclease subunit S [Lactobacillus delbrueckii]MCS8608489.1 restriction endonuclease subunit S [Lactobacillus delbrueckii subsp. lactis]MCS8615010.1 restriction endonuclease subunit S [Lactobacillus delbrueckii subsp. lactis]MCT3461982.1 restriction endonuclease subunit S [Lactobacillus delbrueckii subsp. lactis]MCT3484843.1 restriction endonuclease subunit S [Lactobacillus delbrueckii subsp. lactis]